MILQDGDEPTRGGQRAVERGDGAGAAVGYTLADVQTTGLILGAVRRGGQLAILALGRHPRLAVELAGGGGAQIAGGGVDHAVRHLHLGEHLLLHGQQALVLLVGVLLTGVNEHLHLVELVDADDAGRVLAGGAGLAAVAGAPAAVAQRAVGQIQDLVLMHAGERHLGGADQVLVVRLAQAVDLIGMGVEEAGAAHDLGAHQRRGDGQREAVGLGLVDGHGQHGDLQARHGAAQEVEAGAGDLSAAAGVDAGHQRAERHMVLRLEALRREVARGADLLDDHVVVLAALRRLGLDDVRQLPHGGGVFLGRGVGRGLELGDLLAELLGLGDQRGLLVRRRGGDLLADLLLLGAGGLELLERGAAHLVGAQHLVHQLNGLAALALGFAHHIGMFTDELDIKHGSQTSAASRHWPPTVRHACRYR